MKYTFGEKTRLKEPNPAKEMINSSGSIREKMWHSKHNLEVVFEGKKLMKKVKKKSPIQKHLLGQ